MIDCAVSSCNQSTPAVGFATINIATYQDVILGGGGRNNCQQYFATCSYPAPNGYIDNPSLPKECVPGCSNGGATCQINADCSGCTGGCKNKEGIYINQTCSQDTGGSGGGRCFGNYTAILGQP